jgi:hypothetical protein
LTHHTARNTTHTHNFCNNLEDVLEVVLSSNIWNYDEATLMNDPGSKQITTKKGSKYPEIRGTSKPCTSLIVCGNSEGRLAPLYQLQGRNIVVNQGHHTRQT